MRYCFPPTGSPLGTDEYISTGQGFLGYNMFAYCLNNPVNLHDPDGRSATALAIYFGIKGLKAIIGAATASAPVKIAAGTAAGVVGGVGLAAAAGGGGALPALGEVPVSSAIPRWSGTAIGPTPAPPSITARWVGGTPASPPTPPPGNGGNHKAWNFRQNLLEFTGQSGQGMDAHHVFPQRFESQFQQAGINIHRPQHGSLVPQAAHRSWSHAYNVRWKNFFRSTPNPTQQQIFNFGRQLAGEFGFHIFF